MPDPKTRGLNPLTNFGPCKQPLATCQQMSDTPSILDSDLVGILTRKSMVVVLASKIFTESPVIRYPVKFTVGLWMDNKNHGQHLQCFPASGSGALEAFLCRQGAVVLHSLPNRHFGLGIHLVFGANLGLFGIEG